MPGLPRSSPPWMTRALLLARGRRRLPLTWPRATLSPRAGSTRAAGCADGHCSETGCPATARRTQARRTQLPALTALNPVFAARELCAAPASAWIRYVCGPRVAVPRGVGGQLRVGDAVRLSLGGGVAEHRGQEGFPGEPVHRAAGLRDDTGRAEDGAQQRDLPDSLAAPAAPQETPVPDDVE